MRATFKVEARRSECGGMTARYHYTGPGRFADFLRPYFNRDNMPYELCDPARWGADNTAELTLESDTPINLRNAMAHFKAILIYSVAELSAFCPFAFSLRMEPIR